MNKVKDTDALKEKLLCRGERVEVLKNELLINGEDSDTMKYIEPGRGGGETEVYTGEEGERDNKVKEE